MLLSGVTTVPPRGIVILLTVIPELTKELFGMSLKVLRAAEITQDSNVLLVSVWVCVRYTSPGFPQKTVVPLLVKYFPAPVSALTMIPLPVRSKLSPDTSSSIFLDTELTINGKRSAI